MGNGLACAYIIYNHIYIYIHMGLSTYGVFKIIYYYIYLHDFFGFSDISYRNLFKGKP